MVDQAKVTPANGPVESPPRAAARNAAELLHDILALVEMQGELLAVEFREEIQKAITPAAVLACGIVLAFSCLPLSLVCIALLVVETTDLSHAQAFLATLAGGIVLAVGLMGGSLWYLQKNLRMLQRSRTEWSLNVRWVRGMLKRLGSGGIKPVHFGFERNCQS